MGGVAGRRVRDRAAAVRGRDAAFPTDRLGRLIMVGEPLVAAIPDAGQVVVYARVSSADQRDDLVRQVARVTTWATSQHLAVSRVVTEVGSALNGHGKKYLALLRDPSVSTIVVERWDRFARFGAQYVEAALSGQGRRLLVVDPAEIDDDLVRDVTDILTSLCARLFQHCAGRGTRPRTRWHRGGGNVRRRRSTPAWTRWPAR